MVDARRPFHRGGVAGAAASEESCRQFRVKMKAHRGNSYIIRKGVLHMTDSEDRHESEDGYTKVDKRRYRDGAAGGDAGSDPEEGARAPEAAATSPDAREEPAPEPPAGSGGAESLAEIGVYGLLRFFLGLLAQQAWVALGIQAVGGEIQQNLPEAKVAIDTLSFMAEKLAADLDPAEKRELDTLLANLRVNYIQRVG